jgi:hypothetical protein
MKLLTAYVMIGTALVLSGCSQGQRSDAAPVERSVPTSSLLVESPGTDTSDNGTDADNAAGPFCDQIASFDEILGEPPGDLAGLDALEARLNEFSDAAPAELKEPLAVWSEAVLDLAQAAVEGRDIDQAGSEIESRGGFTEAINELGAWSDANCPASGGSEVPGQ